MRRGVMSPLAEPGRRINHPSSLSVLVVDWKQSAAWTASRLFWPGCGERWGACIDTRCASVPTSQLPERQGCCWSLIRPRPSLLAGSAPTPAGSPPWAGVSTPLGGVASESLELGGGTLSGESRKRCLLSAPLGKESRSKAWQC